MSDGQLNSPPADPKEFVDLLASNYWEAIWRDAYELIGNWEDAEDIAQDTFIRVMKVVEGEPNLKIKAYKPWLRSFLRYAFLDFLRKNRKAGKYNFSEISLERLKTVSSSEWQQLVEELVDSASKTSDIAESKEGVAEIIGEIVKLRNKKMQDELRFHLFGDHTYQEIAEKMRRPLGTVKSDISEGKKLLRIALEERVRDER